MDIRSELQMLVGSFSKSKLIAFLEEMKRNEQPEVYQSIPKKREPATCIRYTSILRKHTCVHCGYVTTSVVNLPPREETSVLTKEGKVMILNSSSPAQVDCATSSCTNCRDYIRMLTREELEERYMELLHLTSLVGNKNYGKNITIERYENTNIHNG